jgi:hypothetical protein
MIILMAVLGAFLWRVRGGLLNSIFGRPNPFGLNDTAVRIIWAIGMALPLRLMDGPSWGIAALPITLFLGTVDVGWFGAALYPTAFRDIALLTASGLVRMSLVAAALLSPGPLLAGLLCGPAYWLAGKLPHPRAWMFWGEWLFGALIGASLCWHF